MPRREIPHAPFKFEPGDTVRVIRSLGAERFAGQTGTVALARREGLRNMYVVNLEREAARFAEHELAPVLNPKPENP